MKQRQVILKQVKDTLQETQHHMKQRADQHRRELHFEVGDQVLVKLQPYRQTSVRDETFSKLRRRFYGPFQVLKRIREVAYKINLPSNAKIHNVFHISKLKAFKEMTKFNTTSLPHKTCDGKILVEPVGILQQRSTMKENVLSKELLIQWEGLGPENATWIELEDFRRTYPSYNLGDKVACQGGSNDTIRDKTLIVYQRRGKEDSLTAVNGKGMAAVTAAAAAASQAPERPKQAAERRAQATAARGRLQQLNSRLTVS